ncbi:hypothetical protein VQ056_33375 [Paenibacillus sp. JTLBN-2024]
MPIGPFQTPGFASLIPWGHLIWLGAGTDVMCGQLLSFLDDVIERERR